MVDEDVGREGSARETSLRTPRTILAHIVSIVSITHAKEKRHGQT